MSSALASTAVSLRPHAKAHKCPQIVLRQVDKGAVGVCCQTVSELEAFAEAGVHDLLMTNQIVDRHKAHRLARIKDDVTIGVCVDDITQVQLLEAVASENFRTINIYVEIEVGGSRCGVEHIDEAVPLIRAVDQSPYLKFAGLQAYNGRIQHIREPDRRRSSARSTGEKAKKFADMLQVRGINVPIITGGGTGSLEHDITGGVFTELQCGSYALMDADYGSLEYSSNSDNYKFENALAVATRVISVRKSEFVVVDAGLKAIAFDSGMPFVQSRSNLLYSNPSDEHGIIRASGGVPLPKLGEVLLLTPGHCDPTVSLHDKLVIYSSNAIKAQWPIVARGQW